MTTDVPDARIADPAATDHVGPADSADSADPAEATSEPIVSGAAVAAGALAAAAIAVPSATAAAAATTAATVTLDDIGAATPSADLCSLEHEIQYSRLFRS